MKILLMPFCKLICAFLGHRSENEPAAETTEVAKLFVKRCTRCNYKPENTQRLGVELEGGK